MSALPAGFPSSDRYELVSLLGSNDMGVVFAVRDRTAGQSVALKALQWPEGQEIMKLKREFRALSDLAHPNLVHLHDLHDLHSVHGATFSTMELVDGPRFVDHVRGPLRRRTGDDTVQHQSLAPVEYDALRGLLQQLIDPSLMWAGCRALLRAGGIGVVMDLFRPPTQLVGRQIVEDNADHDSAILQEDFYRPLLAAFSPAEIEQQLAYAGLVEWTVTVASQRHIRIRGTAPLHPPA